MTAWTICGRAPVLASATQADCIGEVTVINGAVCHEPIRADWWCCADKPARALKDLVLPAYLPPLVTKASHGQHWEDAGHKPARVYSSRDYGPHPEPALALPWKSRTAWAHWSMLLALFDAYRRGARKIRFLGVSMRGASYSYSAARVHAYTNKKGVDDWRWMMERLDVARAMTELTEYGGVEFDGLAFEPREWRCEMAGRGCSKPAERLGYVFGPMVCSCKNARLLT